MLKIERFHSKSERFHTLQRMLNKSAFTLLQNEHSDKIRAFSLFYKTSTATKKEHFHSFAKRAQRQKKSIFALSQKEHGTATKIEHFHSFLNRAQQQKKSVSTL